MRTRRLFAAVTTLVLDRFRPQVLQKHQERTMDIVHLIGPGAFDARSDRVEHFHALLDLRLPTIFGTRRQPDRMDRR
jgi:hypothetical protein